VKVVERLYWVIKLQARGRRMMFVTAGLFVLNLIQQHEGCGDVTVTPEV
jgi:hypothetical protein